ncbi:hypothetical protein Droror1_Dr00028315 [Drosera rotundifolia]
MKNYAMWADQFTSVLLSHDLMGMVDGTITPPPEIILENCGIAVQNPYFLQWRKLDQTIRSWITASITPEVSQDVKHLKTSFAMWQALERRFLERCSATEMDLHLRLNLIKMKPDQSMDEYLR